MAIVYANDVKDDRMAAVRDQIDAGAAAGKLEIGDAGFSTVLATIELADPCGTVASQALTLTMPQSDTNADATGTAAEARIRDSDNNDVITGLTVGTAATDVVLDSVSITAGQTITINSAVITHAT